MKRYSGLLCFLMAAVLLISGCADRTPPAVQEGPKAVEQIGQIPEEWQAVIEENRFKDIAAFEDRVLKTEVLSEHENTVTHRVVMMDLYGQELAGCTLDSDDAYHIETLTATGDGGFLFVLGFRDRARSQSEWASDDGFASRVIKCDPSGGVQFDVSLPDTEGSALEFCFEKNGQFYFFGTAQTPETKERGTYSPTDISMMRLDREGTVLDRRLIAGSDFDDLRAAELTADGFLLSVRSQSDDGDFSGSGSGGYPVQWVIAVDDALELQSMEKGSGREYSDRRIGWQDGKPIYPSSEIMQGFDAGTPTAFLDYGDFYLIVSENVTGFYENTPVFISSIWCYTETVYSAYDPDGTLRFRASVDSSPDFDAMVREITAP